MSNRLKLLREAVRPREMVPILLDGEIRQQIEVAERELGRLDVSERTDKRLSNRTESAQRKELETRVDQLYEAAADTTMWVVLQGMQRTPYRALLAAHPPRLGDDGKPIREDIGGANMEALAIPLVKACIVGYRETPDPAGEVLPIPDDDLDRLLEFCTAGQVDALGAVAIRLCAGDDAGPLWRRRSGTPTHDVG